MNNTISAELETAIDSVCRPRNETSCFDSLSRTALISMIYLRLRLVSVVGFLLFCFKRTFFVD